jgi:WD40 repeat protein
MFNVASSLSLPFEFSQLSIAMSQCPFQVLPKELRDIILTEEGLSLKDISNCSLASKCMYVMTLEGDFWKSLFYRDFGYLPPSDKLPAQAYQRCYSNMSKGVYASSTFGQAGSWVRFLAVQENQLISTYTIDHTIKIWDLNTKQCSNLGKHVECIAIVYAPDGAPVSISEDGVVKYWDCEKKLASTLPCVGSFGWHRDPPTAIFFVGQKYFFGLPNHTIGSCDWRSGEPLAQPLEGHEKRVSCFACAGEEFLISGSEDKTVRVWNLKRWECCAVLDGHVKTVNALAVASGKIISGSEDCTIRVWDLKTGAPLYTFNDVQGSPIWSLTVKADKVFSCSREGHVNVWNLHTGKLCYTILEPREGERWVPARCYGFSLSKEKLYTRCRGGGIQVRDFGARDDEVLKELAGLFRNRSKEASKEAMERYSRMPEAVQDGINSELTSILGPDHAQQEEVTVEQMALAIEQYIAKHYSYSS